MIVAADIFYREQQLGIRGHRVSFIGEGRTSDLAPMVDGSVRESMSTTMTDEAHQNPRASSSSDVVNAKVHS